MKQSVVMASLLSFVVGAISCSRGHSKVASDAGDSGSPSSDLVPLDTGPGSPDSGADAPSGQARCPAGLDLGFGQQGRYEAPSGTPTIEAVLAQAGGPVVAVGAGVPGWLQGDVPTVFSAVRLLGDGRPDPSFGVGGTATVEILPNGRGFVRSAALQSDGKVIMVGAADPRVGAPAWLVVRFNQDGTLDTSFGSGGVAPAPLADASPTSVAIAADGSVLVAGTVSVHLGEYCCDGNVVLATYDARGRLDPKFGSDGLVRTPVGVAGGDDYASAVVVQPDGYIVVGGRAFVTADDGNPEADAMLLRYSPDGALDSAFGTGGLVLTKSYVAANALALQSDGKLLVSLFPGGNSTYFAVGRYTTAGALDLTFGTGGVARIELPTSYGPPDGAVASSLFWLRDGSIGLAGLGNPEAFFLAKLGAEGALDTAFGNDGFVETNLIAGAAAVAPDGKAVVAGIRLVDASAAVVVVERYCF